MIVRPHIAVLSAVRVLTLAVWFWLPALPAFACALPSDYVPIAQREPKALLFKLSGCDMPDSYLFGTFHSDAPTLKPLLDHAGPYIARTQRLWLEIVSTPESALAAQRYLALPPESPNLEQLIGEELFAEAVEKIGPVLNVPEAVMQRFRPWALALLVQYPPPQADGVILDAKLQSLAARKAVPFSALETLEDQFTIFTDMTPAMQRDFLKSTLEDFGRLQETIDKLDAHYHDEHILAIHRLSRSLFDDMAQDYPELARYLERRLIVERNLHMAARLAPKLGKPAFIAVGALHLPGESGLWTQLEALGLQITPLPMPD